MAGQDDWEAHLQRHTALCARWGRPEPVDMVTAVGVLGAEAANPDAYAFRYTSREAAEAFAASNLEHYGYRSFGPVVTDDGVIGAVIVTVH
jgi:hypothetical protein